MPSTLSTTDPLAFAAARRVVLCVGPGGVGKTTCAAALALGSAQRGRKVLVVTIDPSRRLAQALGFAAEASAGMDAGIPQPVPLPPGGTGTGSLDALWLATEQVFAELVRTYAADAAAAEAILRNPIYTAMARNLGGALEYAAMAKLQMLHAARSYDLIVLDTPPTANAIDFLSAPERIHELATNPAARLLTGSGRLGARLLGIGNSLVLRTLSSLAGSSFLTELGAFLRDFSTVLAAFQARAGDFQSLLTSPETGVVLATSASPFSVREALDFLRVLRERGLRVDSVVLNRVLPPFPPAPDADTMRAALAPRLPPGHVLEDSLQRVLATHAGLSAQGQQGAQARAAFASAHPGLPLWLLPQREPPPTSLTDLQELVTQFVRAA
jgi:anion-transporting  ArsA/GET3 family ATPase